MKVFLDTNAPASALAARGLCADLFEVVLQSHELLISDPLLKEPGRILHDKPGQTKSITEDFIGLLRTEGNPVTDDRPAPSLPDPGDEPIVASALAGGAMVFVTGDKAFLKLKTVEELPILSPRALWERLSTGE